MSYPRPEEKLECQINVALTREYKAHFDRYAAKHRRRPGELARLIVTDWIEARLKEEGIQAPPQAESVPPSPFR